MNLRHDKNAVVSGPHTVPLDVENYPIAPDGLELEQVHLYVRHGEWVTVWIISCRCLPEVASLLYTVHVYVHVYRMYHACSNTGERTPVRVRMADPPASIPDRWNMCKTARRLRAAVTSNVDGDPLTSIEDLSVRKVVERADGSVAEDEW
jgi:acid phosphatase